MKKAFFLLAGLLLVGSIWAQDSSRVRKRDRKRDVLVQTSMGDMVLRLNDSTPLHRDNFIRLVRKHFYDSVLFHRVIQRFMIQAGDPDSKRADSGKALGSGGPKYTIPAEIRTTLFHRKGMLAAARTGDNVNPERRSSSSQFYIVQGRVFTDLSLDSVETYRLKGRKIPAAHREVYKTIGGAPHLDQSYTIFGELVKGMEVLDAIAATPTSKGVDRDRPLKDVRIIKMKMIRRKSY